MRANGGLCGAALPVSSGAGGGRIVVDYSPVLQAGQPQPTVIFQAAGGNLSYYAASPLPAPQAGTVQFPDNSLLTANLTSYFKNLRLFGFSSWAPDSLTVTNADVAFEVGNFALTVTNNISISGAGGSLTVTNAAVNCGGSLTLGTAASLYLYSGMTDAVWTSYGSLLSVTGDVSIASTGAWLYVYSHPTNGGSCLLRMSNLWASATNAGINAVGGGYRGGRVAGETGKGPGTTVVGANNTSGGAGYGGRGGDSLRTDSGSAVTGGGYGGRAYGSPYAPVEPGSGGGAGYSTYIGGDGGGLVRVQAAGKVLVNGVIDASGTYSGGTHSGGGSGGGIYIACNTFASTGGVLRANGGNSGPAGDGGAAGGGRIAVVYNPTAQSNEPIPSAVFQASPGTDHGLAMSYGLSRITKPDIGTLYLPDRSFLTNSLLTANFQGVDIYGWTSWAASSLTLSNATVRFGENGFQLTVTNGVTIAGTRSGLGVTNNGTLTCGSMSLANGASYYALNVNCAGGVTLGTGCTFYAYAFVTNGAGPNYGALVSVAGGMDVASNAWVVPISHPTNGASTLFRVGGLSIAGGANGGFNARGRGYQGGNHTGLAGGQGPGGGGAAVGNSAAGGGYGGSGGWARAVSPGGITYGSSNAPVQPGSGGARCGGQYSGGEGGGLVRIEAAGSVAINGTIDARGTDCQYDHDGAGSGGGIYLVCRFLSGNGSLRADGAGYQAATASRNGGDGGGGRIAVWTWKGFNTFTGTASATTNTVGAIIWTPARTGTVFWFEMPVPTPGLFIQVR